MRKSSVAGSSRKFATWCTAVHIEMRSLASFGVGHRVELQRVKRVDVVRLPWAFPLLNFQNDGKSHHDSPPLRAREERVVECADSSYRLSHSTQHPASFFRRGEIPDGSMEQDGNESPEVTSQKCPLRNRSLSGGKCCLSSICGRKAAEEHVGSSTPYSTPAHTRQTSDGRDIDENNILDCRVR
jgi:hypothetical protein